MSAESITATFSFTELIDRIAGARELLELQLLESVVCDEKRKYTVFQLRLIVFALDLKKKWLNDNRG